jgi:hypothetical protein
LRNWQRSCEKPLLDAKADAKDQKTSAFPPTRLKFGSNSPQFNRPAGITDTLNSSVSIGISGRRIVLDLPLQAGSGVAEYP